MNNLLLNLIKFISNYSRIYTPDMVNSMEMIFIISLNTFNHHQINLLAKSIKLTSESHNTQPNHFYHHHPLHLLYSITLHKAMGNLQQFTSLMITTNYP
jgi:hypothetical protein